MDRTADEINQKGVPCRYTPQFVEKLVFLKLRWLLRNDAEWRFLRPKVYVYTN